MDIFSASCGLKHGLTAEQTIPARFSNPRLQVIRAIAEISAHGSDATRGEVTKSPMVVYIGSHTQLLAQDARHHRGN